MATTSKRGLSGAKRPLHQRILEDLPAVSLALVILAAGCGGSSGENVGLGEGDSPFPLAEGTASVTGPYPGGSGSCGSTGDEIVAKYPGFVMAAVPSAFFATYNPATSVGLQCDSASKVVVDADGKPLCFELTIDSEIRKVVVADVCAGNCVSNVADCGTPGATPSNDCGTTSASCLDCSDHPEQFKPEWRCPEMPYCYETANAGASWADHAGGFYAYNFGITPTTQCTEDGFSPSGDFPGGHVDWCSGSQPHFDLQRSQFSPSNNVAAYKRIDCPAT